MRLQPTYKRDLNGSIRMHVVEVEGNKYRTESGLIDGTRTVSEWTEVFGKNAGKSNATTDEEQALRVATRIRQIRLEQGDHEKIEDVDRGKSFMQPMLAARWDNVKDKVIVSEKSPIFIQPKLDGCRCLVSREGMQTRTGKVWVSAPHIFEQLKPIFEKYPDLVLDGELYNHDLNEDFNKIISLVKKSKPTEEDLKESAEKVQYWIYDIWSDPGTFSDRAIHLNRLFSENHCMHSPSFVQVNTYKITNKEDVQNYLERFVSQGYEGAIVRLDAPYEFKRSKNLLKVKQFQDEEFPIVRIEEGRGNLSGKAGRIVVNADGVEVAAGLKFSHEEAEEIWKNRDYYIGKKATIKFFNKTEDGSLRFPKCIQIDRESYE